MIIQKFSATQKTIFHLDGNLILDLQTPITMLLPQVYEHTLARQLPGFKALRTCVTSNFKPLRNCPLTLEQKRGLCRFLQGTLFSVGKHSVCASRLDVVCTRQAGQYSLRVIGNGAETMDGAQSITSSQGIQQSLLLSRHLRGRFRRIEISPRGTLYELTWPSPAKQHGGFGQFIPQLPQPLWFNQSAR
ncbi:MAG: hypothetical protein F6J95_025210 [Leptolyngbya sp. SIO1E4]|nr:hypothetical protein [Leptolyngbya sp. SIO1E4]